MGLIFLLALIWGLFKFCGKIFASVESSTPVTDEDVARQLKILQVLLPSNQPGAEKAMECLSLVAVYIFGCTYSWSSPSNIW